MLCLETTIKGVRRVYLKLRKQQHVITSIEDLIAAHRWPAGGLSQIYNVVVDCFQKLKEDMRSGFSLNATKSLYNSFMGLMCTSAYFSPQGRLAAVQSLKFGQRVQLLTTKCVMSSVFKTASKYGFQPITASVLFSDLLQFYLDFYRARGVSDTEDSPLFVNYSGESCYNFGRAITKFCLDKLGITISSNTFRSMFETGASELEEVSCCFSISLLRVVLLLYTVYFSCIEWFNISR